MPCQAELEIIVCTFFVQSSKFRALHHYLIHFPNWAIQDGPPPPPPPPLPLLLGYIRRPPPRRLPARRPLPVRPRRPQARLRPRPRPRVLQDQLQDRLRHHLRHGEEIWSGLLWILYFSKVARNQLHTHIIEGHAHCLHIVRSY